MIIKRRFFGEKDSEIILDATCRGSHMNNPKIIFGPDDSLKLIFEMDTEFVGENSVFIEIIVPKEDLEELKFIYDFGFV